MILWFRKFSLELRWIKKPLLHSDQVLIVQANSLTSGWFFLWGILCWPVSRRDAETSNLMVHLMVSRKADGSTCIWQRNNTSSRSVEKGNSVLLHGWATAIAGNKLVPWSLKVYFGGSLLHVRTGQLLLLSEKFENDPNSVEAFLDKKIWSYRWWWRVFHSNAQHISLTKGEIDFSIFKAAMSVPAVQELWGRALQKRCCCWRSWVWADQEQEL